MSAGETDRKFAERGGRVVRRSVGMAIALAIQIFLFTPFVQAESQSIAYDPGDHAMINAAGQVVAASKRQIRFYDPDGSSAATVRLKGNELISLPAGGGNVVGLTRYHDHSPTTLKPIAFELYDISGTRLYRMTKPQFTSVIVSPTGNAIVGHDGIEGLAESTLRFYDATGTEVKAISVEQFQGGQFSANGSVFAYRTAQDGVLVYSADGEPLAHFGGGARYEMSANGSVVAVWQDQAVRCYQDGKRVQTIPTAEIVRALAVSSTGTHIGWVGVERGEVYALGDSVPIATLTVNDENENFRSLAISDTYEFVAVGVDSSAGRSVPMEKRHTRGFVRVFDLGGTLQQEQDFTYNVWNAQTPAVQFVEDEPHVAVILRKGVHFLSLPAPVKTVD